MAAVALGRDFEFKVAGQEVCPTGVAQVDAAVGGLSNESKHVGVLCAEAVQALLRKFPA